MGLPCQNTSGLSLYVVPFVFFLFEHFKAKKRKKRMKIRRITTQGVQSGKITLMPVAAYSDSPLETQRQYCSQVEKNSVSLIKLDSFNLFCLVLYLSVILSQVQYRKI